MLTSSSASRPVHPDSPSGCASGRSHTGHRIIVGCIGVSAPGMAPFLQSGQLSALLPGLTSSAEYELLINRKGLAIAGVDAVSMSHILVVLLVVLGNIGYFVHEGEEANNGTTNTTRRILGRLLHPRPSTRYSTRRTRGTGFAESVYLGLAVGYQVALDMKYRPRPVGGTVVQQHRHDDRLRRSRF